MKEVAILIDGGYLSKVFKYKTGKVLTAEDVIRIADKTIDRRREELFRIYYYDAPPYKEELTNPLDGTKIDYSANAFYDTATNFHISLAEKNYVALRLGKLYFSGWKLSDYALRRISHNRNKPVQALGIRTGAPAVNPGATQSLPEHRGASRSTAVPPAQRSLEGLRGADKGKRTINASDIIPDFKQKAVDMKIGLDIAWLATKKIVDTVMLITADNDFIPAMKFARKEGIHVAIAKIERLNSEMLQHSDRVIEINISQP